MAEPTAANGQVTDSVTQAQTQVLGIAPAHATAAVYQSLAHSVGLSMQNAVAQQQQMYAIGVAVTTQCVAQLTGLPTATATRTPQEAVSASQLASLVRELAETVRLLRDLTPGGR